MSEATYEQVLEYCRKRCLALMDREFFEHLKCWPADMVQVVRCKDCSFWYVPKLTNGEKLGACGWWSGNAHIRATRAEDYCSRSVRKEGEG